MHTHTHNHSRTRLCHKHPLCDRFLPGLSLFRARAFSLSHTHAHVPPPTHFPLPVSLKYPYIPTHRCHIRPRTRVCHSYSRDPAFSHSRFLSPFLVEPCLSASLTASLSHLLSLTLTIAFSFACSLSQPCSFVQVCTQSLLRARTLSLVHTLDHATAQCTTLQHTAAHCFSCARILSRLRSRLLAFSHTPFDSLLLANANRYI